MTTNRDRAWASAQDAFDQCRTHEQTNKVYKELFVSLDVTTSAADINRLMEMLRLAAVRIVAGRRGEESQEAQEAAALAKEAETGVPASYKVRNWAFLKGIPLAKKGRVPQAIVDRYIEDVGLAS